MGESWGYNSVYEALGSSNLSVQQRKGRQGKETGLEGLHETLCQKDRRQREGGKKEGREGRIGIKRTL